MAQPPSGGCVLKPRECLFRNPSIMPAAFGRLCVETIVSAVAGLNSPFQPPSGGCVLKLPVAIFPAFTSGQPPSGGCVLKLDSYEDKTFRIFQPPSGGCVLKR